MRALSHGERERHTQPVVMTASLAVFLLITCELATATPLTLLPRRSIVGRAETKLHHEMVLSLRGGSDDDLDEEDLDDEDDAASVAGDALENPFLGGQGAGAGAGGAGGVGLDDLASTLEDPAALQNALKEVNTNRQNPYDA